MKSSRVLALLFTINLLNYIDRYVLPGVLPLIEEEFAGITKAQLGWLAPAFLVIYMLTSPAFGVLGDRFPRKFLVGIGLQLWSLATASAGLARTFGQLFLSRMMVGIGEAAYGTTAPTILSDLYPPNIRGRILSFFYLAIPLGAALGIMLGGFLGAKFSWRIAFMIVGLPGLLIGLLAYGMNEPKRGAAEGLAEKELDQYLSRKICWNDYLQFFSNRSYLLNTLGMTAYTYAVGGISYWMPSFLNQQRHLPLEFATFRLGLVTVVTGILGTIGGGFIADRLARKIPGAYFFISGLGMLMACPALYLVITSEMPGTYWPALFIAELMLFLNTGPSNTIIVNVTHPRLRNSAFALNIFIIHALGDVLSPVVMGKVADGRDLSTAFLTTIGVVVLGGIIWLAGMPYLKKDAQRVLQQMRGAEQSKKDGCNLICQP